MILRRSISAIASVLALAAGMILGNAGRTAEPLSFYVDYSARVPTAPLLAHPLSIVHPDAQVDLVAAHAAGNVVLAYLSIGEIASDAPYRADVVKLQLPFAGRNAVWNSDIADLTDPRWAEFLVTKLAPVAEERGFDGWFLDTLDSVDLVAPRDPSRTAALRAGLVAAVKRLRAAFPAKRIVVNRGFFAFDELRDSIDGVLAESLYETHDFTAKTSRTVPAADSEALLTQLRRVTAAGRKVYVLDYTDPNDAARATTAANRIRALGFNAFISVPALDGTMLAPLRPVGRRVLSFYGNLTTVQEDQVRWPAESFTALRLQLPLEWLGYEVDYAKILTAADLPTLGSEYRAIVLPRFWEIPPATEAAVVDWLVVQRNAGKKILIFGGLPFRDVEQRDRFITAFGLSGSGAVTSSPYSPTIVTKDDTIMDFEAPVVPLPVGHRDLRAPADARRILTVQAKAKEGPANVYDAIFTCSWGGMVSDPYVIFRRADYREFWHVDPFKFLVQALNDVTAPVPDTTTRDGLRMFLNHIDGDGFSNFSRVQAGQRSAEIIRDRILKRYPLPVTVSVIEAEVRGLIRTQRAEDGPALEAMAREIFALPQVEAASHTFSHPFFWIVGDRTEAFYDEQNLDLKVPYPKLDLAREIEGSVNYINQKIAAPGRPVRVFLWSGNCRPPPEALALTRKLGLENLNGGDTIITARNKTLTTVAPRTMPWGDELQVYAPNQNENVYTNNWRGPLFGTFTHVLDTFELTETPRRLKPVNLYYHFYSGDYAASIHALETIYDWVMAQPLHAVTVSAYARMARDARDTAVFSAGPDRWVITSRGESRTLRLPAAQAARIDLPNSTGITGWKREREQAYIHLDGSPVVTLTLGSEPVAGPRLESSSAEIKFTQRGAAGCAFTVSDVRDVLVTFAGLKPSAPVRATVGGANQSLTTDNSGSVTLTLPPQASVVLDFSAASP